jgi:hypothetical protein
MIPPLFTFFVLMFLFFFFFTSTNASCLIEWSVDVGVQRISSTTTPSSHQVVVSSSPSTPPRGTDWNVTVKPFPFNVSALVNGGAYIGKLSDSRDVLIIQQSNSFDVEYIYVFCTVDVAATKWSVNTTLIASDDADRAGNVSLQFWNTPASPTEQPTFVQLADSILATSAGSMPTPTLHSKPIRAQLELIAPTTELKLRFVIASNGSGIRDAFGIGSIQIGAIGMTNAPTSTPTTTTTTTTVATTTTTTTATIATSTSTTLISNTYTSATLSTSTSTLTSTSTNTDSPSSSAIVFVSDAIRSGELDVAMIAGIAGGVGGLFVCICLVLVVVCWQRKRASSQPHVTQLRDNDDDVTISNTTAPVATMPTEYGHLLPTHETRSSGVEADLFDEKMPEMTIYDRVPGSTARQSEY